MIIKVLIFIFFELSNLRRTELKLPTIRIKNYMSNSVSNSVTRVDVCF